MNLKEGVKNSKESWKDENNEFSINLVWTPQGMDYEIREKDRFIYHGLL